MSIFAELTRGVSTRSADEMQTLAAGLAAEISGCSAVTLALHGDLGAGKTTFTQGVAKGLGIQEPVTSPTFGIFTWHRGLTTTLVHLDAYRLVNSAQLEDLMIDEFLVRPFILVVEWPENVADWLPSDAVHLWLSIGSEGEHLVRADALRKSAE